MVTWPHRNDDLRGDEGTLYAYLKWKFGCVANVKLNSHETDTSQALHLIGKYLHHVFGDKWGGGYSLCSIRFFIVCVRANKRYMVKSNQKRYLFFRSQIDTLYKIHHPAFQSLHTTCRQYTCPTTLSISLLHTHTEKTFFS